MPAARQPAPLPPGSCFVPSRKVARNVAAGTATLPRELQRCRGNCNVAAGTATLPGERRGQGTAHRGDRQERVRERLSAGRKSRRAPARRHGASTSRPNTCRVEPGEAAPSGLRPLVRRRGRVVEETRRPARSSDNERGTASNANTNCESFACSDEGAVSGVESLGCRVFRRSHRDGWGGLRRLGCPLRKIASTGSSPA